MAKEHDILINRDSNGKIRIVDISLDWNDDLHAFLIQRKTSVMGGKITEQPIIEIKRGLASRSVQEQALLQYKSNIKKYLDKGYKNIKDLGYNSLNEFNPDEILDKNQTDANGFKKHMLAKSSNDVATKIFDSVPVWYASRKIDGCFKGNTMITTDQGLKRIDEIVNKKLQLNVLSYNETTQQLEYKPIINWFDNGTASSKDFCQIQLTHGKTLVCTKNHKFYSNREWIEIEKCQTVNKITLSNEQESLLLGTLLGDSCFTFDYRQKNPSYRFALCHKDPSFLQQVIELLGFTGKYSEFTSGYGSKCYRFTSSALVDLLDCNKYYHLENGRYIRNLYTAEFLNNNLTDLGVSIWIADDGSISYNNGNKNTPILHISTEGWDIKQIEEFEKFFKLRYNITITRIVDKRKVNDKQAGIRLRFKTTDTLKLLNILKNYIFKSVEYKYYYTDGKYATLEQSISEVPVLIKPVKSSNRIHKYDIEVADNHNYFANGFLVHNCRCSFYWKDNQIHTASRGGGNYDAACQDFINHPKFIEFFKKHPDIVLDGEMYKFGLSLQQISGCIRTELSEGKYKLEYYIYDTMTEDKTFEERLQELEMIKNELNLDFQPEREWDEDDLRVQIVPHEKVSGWSNIKKLHDKYVNEGWEGLVIRDPSKKYKYGGRSNNMIKVKERQEETFTIVGYELGLRGVEDMVFRMKTQGNIEFLAKPMGSREVKENYMKNIDSLIGKPGECTFFYLSDDGVPLQPVFKAVRLDLM